MTTKHLMRTAASVSYLTFTLLLVACSSSPTSPTSETTAATTLTDLSLSAASAQPGGTVQGTLTLSSAAPAGGMTVAMSSSNSAVAKVPASITIPPGSPSGTFVVSAVAQGSATIMAATSGAQRTATLTVTSVPALLSFTLSASTVVGGNSVTGTVALSAAAPAASARITLTTADPLSSPTTITVPAGATSATFAVLTRAVGGTIPGTIAAAYAGRTLSAQLFVTKPTTATAIFGVTGPTMTETCTLSNNGMTLDCTFDGSESTAPGTIVAWDWTFGVATVVAITTTGPVLSMPAVDCSLVPPPPLPSGQSWLTMPVTLRVRDDAGNVSDVAVHRDTRLFPQGSCGY